MTAENGVIKSKIESYSQKRNGKKLGVEKDHLTAENDGLTIKNWYQNGRKHNQKKSYFESEKFRNMGHLLHIFGKNL